jgi:hypothetical protein
MPTLGKVLGQRKVSHGEIKNDLNSSFERLKGLKNVRKSMPTLDVYQIVDKRRAKARLNKQFDHI